MTAQDMINILVDKGHSRDYAERLAPLDIEQLNMELYEDLGGPYECSICRRAMNRTAWTYHYHPCE
jgi:hypothetical protein